MSFWGINRKLCNLKNWTDELRYVHETRLIGGFVIGLMVGFCLAWLVIG